MAKKRRNNRRIEEEDEVEEQIQEEVTTKKQDSKNQKKNTQPVDFSVLQSLGDGDDMPQNDEDSKDDDETIDEEFFQVKSKKNKNRNKKKGKKNVQNEEDEVEQPKKQESKKEKKKLDPQDYYAMLDVDEGLPEDQQNDDEEQIEEIQIKSKKKDKKKQKEKKSKKKGKMSDEDYLAMMNENIEEQEKPQEEQEIKQEQKGKKDKKKGKKKKMSDEDYLAMMNENIEEQEKPQEETKPTFAFQALVEEENKPEEKKQEQKGKKEKKKKKKKMSDEDYLAMMNENIEEQEKPQEETKPAFAFQAMLEEEKPVPEKTEKKKKKKEKKKEKKAKKEVEEEEEEEETLEKPKPKKDDKKQKEEKVAKKPARRLNPRLEALRKAQEEKRRKEEELRRQLQREEEEKRRLEKEAELQRKRELAEQERKRREEKARIKELKKKGLYLTPKQLEERRLAEQRREMFLKSGLIAAVEKKDKKNKKSDKKPDKKKEKKQKKEETTIEKKEEKKEEKPVEEQQQQQPEEEVGGSWEDLLGDDDDIPETKPEETEAPKQEEAKVEEPKQKETKTEKSEETKPEEPEVVVDTKPKLKKGDLRSPICCVLGHVDAGKTKILDKIRRTNVQLGEEGGITQQIGATYVPMEAIKKETAVLNEKLKLKYKIPGLLIIDTPGHESFNNLRSRGSGLCDIAILVVDILEGLENQTIESLNLLKMRRTPFVVALNKIDQLTEWKSTPNTPFMKTFKKQGKNTLKHFESRVKRIIMEFAEQGLNAVLYHENRDFKNYVSLVPTSAVTGEGIPDLLLLMTQLTQTFMAKKITYKDELECTVLEVKVVPGHGTTIDVVLVNGVLRYNDTIVVCGLNGPIVTQIRALLTPKPLREMRVKGDFIKHNEIRAAQGVKIAANGLEGAIAGSELLVAKPGDDIEELKEEVMKDLENLKSRISKEGKGVCVQASTLGSLEALLCFLNSVDIPVSGVNIGPVYKKDVMRAAVMLEHAPEYALILAFDVPVAKEAEELAEQMGVKIFTATVIYHLFDKFTAYMEEYRRKKKEESQAQAVFPCVLQIMDENVFHKRDPITCGVDIKEGKLKLQTPLVAYFPPDKENPEPKFLDLGRVVSIQKDKVPIKEASQGDKVAIQIDSGKSIMYGRHFDYRNIVYSKISRESIDVLKENFKDEITHDDMVLIQKLKKIFKIPDAGKIA